jgi:hypothetical protein
MSERKSNSKTPNEFRRTKSEGVSDMSNNKTKANEFCWTSGVVKLAYWRKYAA